MSSEPKTSERRAEGRAEGESRMDVGLVKMSEKEEAAFRAAVQLGIEQADRGEFIEEAEMDARVERMIRDKE
jgi:predicted transcriptional regulator